jgi:hypothetical protein
MKNDKEALKGNLIFERRWESNGSQIEYRLQLYKEGIEAFFGSYRKKKDKDPTIEYIHFPFLARHRFLNYEEITGIYRINIIEKWGIKTNYGYHLRIISNRGKNRYLIADTEIRRNLEEIDELIPIMEQCFGNKWKMIYKPDPPLVHSY